VTFGPVTDIEDECAIFAMTRQCDPAAEVPKRFGEISIDKLFLLTA